MTRDPLMLRIWAFIILAMMGSLALAQDDASDAEVAVEECPPCPPPPACPTTSPQPNMDAIQKALQAIRASEEDEDEG